MPPEPATLLHIGFGALAILLYWAAATRRKGGAAHRRLGRLFLLSWIPVLGTVAGVFFLSSRPFAAAEIVQFVYLSLCVVAVGGTAFLAIRWKRDLARFRGLWLRASGGVVLALGAVVLAAGLAEGNPVPVAFSTVGLLWGAASLRFAFISGPVDPRWSRIWHLNGMVFLFNATHGTVLAVLWRVAVDPEAGPWLNVATHFGTMALCLAARLWLGARHDAPMRMRAAPGAVFA